MKELAENLTHVAQLLMDRRYPQHPVFEVPPKKAELVKLRFFVGFELGEAAQALGISEATSVRWWNYAKAWLAEEVGEWKELPRRA